MDPGEACVQAGLGNLGTTDIEALVFVDQELERDSANNNGGLLNIEGAGGFQGSWSFAPEVWDDWGRVYLYFHFGHVTGLGAAYNPDHFIVEIPTGVVVGKWVVNPGDRGALSSVALLVGGKPTEIPAPAPLGLLGLGILGLAVAIRRNRRI
ncbi:MAG: hypothetical protein JJT85_00395 [Chromatiales bacterium]|nr:hypothetical protein [Chromatiales bacterium]